ncbi:hypothetical protein ACOMHN_014080 [Nucella lapillus]
MERGCESVSLTDLCSHSSEHAAWLNATVQTVPPSIDAFHGCVKSPARLEAMTLAAIVCNSLDVVDIFPPTEWIAGDFQDNRSGTKAQVIQEGNAFLPILPVIPTSSATQFV